MRRQHGRGRSELRTDDHRPVRVLADPVAVARTISEKLPDAIDRAEAAGLSIIAQHLAKALNLARRIVASDENAG